MNPFRSVLNRLNKLIELKQQLQYLIMIRRMTSRRNRSSLYLDHLELSMLAICLEYNRLRYFWIKPLKFERLQKHDV